MDATVDKDIRQHIVVIEDDANIRSLIHDILTEEGYSVTPYAQATDDVFASLQDRQPNLLMCELDISAVMSGAELIRLVADDARTRHIPIIIICSPTPELSAVAHTFRRRSVHMLMKPFGMNDLIATVTAGFDEADSPTD